MKLRHHIDEVRNQRLNGSAGRPMGALLPLFFFIVALHLSGVRLSAAVDIYPGANIRQTVYGNPAGTTFVIHPGLYRLAQPIDPKYGDTFTGQPGAVLSGARLLTSFQHTSSYYYVTGQTQQGQLTTDSTHCLSGYPRCNYPEDLYFDDVPWVHVASLSDLGPGKWFFDYANHTICFYDDPAGHRVETSVTPYAFTPGPANNVTIQGLTVEKFASPLMTGAIGGAWTGGGSTTTGANWVVKNNEIRLNHANGVRINFGWQVLNNRIHHNGNMGIGGGLGNTTVPCRVLIQGNEVAYNDYAHVTNRFGAGGIKICSTRGLVVRGNNSHHNLGDGIHLDTFAYDTLYDNNIVADNTSVGIWHEISYAATVRNNKLLRNGYVYPSTPAIWLYAANLLSASSQNVEAYCNTVEVSAQGGNGIDILTQSRPGMGPSQGNYFHHNTVVFDGNSGKTGAANGDPTGQPNFFSLNGFDYNTYHLPNLSRRLFAWNNNDRLFSEFQAYGQDRHGSADTHYTGSVPDVAITSPADGSTVSGVVDVNGAVQDDNLSKAVIYVDWIARDTRYASPFSFPWHSQYYPNGKHVVAVMAYDKQGMSACYAVTLSAKN